MQILFFLLLLLIECKFWEDLSHKVFKTCWIYTFGSFWWHFSERSFYHQSSPNFPGGAHGQIPPATAGDSGDNEFDPQVRKIPWSRKHHPTLLFLPGKFHELRSLVSYSPWGCKKLDVNKHASLPKFSSKDSFWLVFLEYWQVRGENEMFGTLYNPFEYIF